MWPGRTPLRQRLRRTSPNAPWLTVVGVVDDVMDSGLGLPLGPTLYVPYLQQNTNTARVTLVVRVQGNPESHIASVRDAIWSVDPLQPIDQPQSITGVLNASIAQPRFRTFVLSAFGACGLVLACGGAYGIATFAAVRRRREIGIRVALGADPSSVVRLVVVRTG
jgi:putative ABC transport system permease protein